MGRVRRRLLAPDKRLVIPRGFERRKIERTAPWIWVPKRFAPQASVALDVKGTEKVVGTGSSPFTFTGLLNITSGLTNPAAVFTVAISPTTTLTSITCTWNGVNCPIIGSLLQISATYSVGIFGIVNPASGSNNFVVTITGSIPATPSLYVDGVSFSGVNQTGGTTTFANFNSIGPNSSSVPSRQLAITTTSGNYTICASANGNSTTLSTASTPGTNNQLFTDNTDPGADGIGAMAAINASTSTSTTYTFSLSPSDFLGMVGCDIVAATGAATNVPYQPYFQQFLAS